MDKKYDFCLIKKSFLDAINDRKTIILPREINTLFGIGFCQEKTKQVVFFNKINENTVKRVCVRILAAALNISIQLSLKGKIIIDIDAIYKDLSQSIKNNYEEIKDFLTSGIEYFYFEVIAKKHNGFFEIYLKINNPIWGKKFDLFYYKTAYNKGNKIKQVFIDELKKIEFDYNKIIELTKKEIKNG